MKNELPEGIQMNAEIIQGSKSWNKMNLNNTNESATADFLNLNLSSFLNLSSKFLNVCIKQSSDFSSKVTSNQQKHKYPRKFPKLQNLTVFNH